MAGLDPAISRGTVLVQMAGSSPAMTRKAACIGLSLAPMGSAPAMAPAGVGRHRRRVPREYAWSESSRSGIIGPSPNRNLIGGRVAKASKKRAHPPKPSGKTDRFREPRDGLPNTALVLITGTDSDGDPVGRPDAWKASDGRAPLIRMVGERPGQPALAPGDRVLAQLRPVGANRYQGRTLQRLSESPSRVLGVFRPGHSDGRIVPTDRRAKAEWIVPHGQDAGAQANELVLAEPLPHSRLGLKPARIIERLGKMGDAKSVSLIAIHANDIPVEFPDDALVEASAAGAVDRANREDLRDIPLITIDGEDARDFDDAVFAEGDGAGFRLIVAIADVAWYVRPGSALDRAARTRGNSVYFPDRVVPMLPEQICNHWCSLLPEAERGCIFVEMRIDRTGRKISHRFGRGLMRSAARLTYEQVQHAVDSRGDLIVDPRPLYDAHRALLGARIARGALDLDLAERKVSLSPSGEVLAVAPRPRLDSHRLIEEFMVLANVAAAEELERLHRPCVYRVHAPPSDEKLAALRGFLNGMGISLPPGDQVHSRDLDRVLRRVAGTPDALVVNDVMLRSQSQAAYSADNIGHFGLALARYAHFTSPIRRYADLLVHRSLIAGLGLGPGGLGEHEAAQLTDIAARISATERRAVQAERDAMDRYLAAFMADKIGARFTVRISGVTRFGLFVTVPDSGATGLIPMAALPDDFWHHDEMAQTLTGRRSRQVYRLSQDVEVRLVEANPVTGGLVFQIPRAEQPRKRPRPR
jgi:ribonuclease R